MDGSTIGEGRRVTVALLTAVVLAGCGDAGSPLDPGPASVIDEGGLDQAVATLEPLSREMGVQVEDEAERDRGRRRDPTGDRARDRTRDLDRIGLAVRLAGSAVSLATRILEAGDPDPGQLRLLDAARHFLGKAREALAEGDGAGAVRNAEKACWTALKAVILPGGVTEEEVRFVHDLAGSLLDAARAEVGAGGTAVERTLLGWAARFYRIGSEQVQGGDVLGVAALWKSAVLSHWILG